jgi:hypothetical protein
MRKTSLASLKERLTGWLPWDKAMYEVGACLGFWPEFGAPPSVDDSNDPWNGVKDVIYTTKHEPLGAILEWFLIDLVEVGCIEDKAVDEDGVPTSYYRWNPNYKGEADIITML